MKRKNKSKSAGSQWKTMENAKITKEKSLLINFLNSLALYLMQCNKKIGFKQKNNIISYYLLRTKRSKRKNSPKTKEMPQKQLFNVISIQQNNVLNSFLC